MSDNTRFYAVKVADGTVRLVGCHDMEMMDNGAVMFWHRTEAGQRIFVTMFSPEEWRRVTRISQERAEREESDSNPICWVVAP